MEKSKIKLAIIGAGRMGITHYSIINSHPNAEVVAVADPSTIVLTMMKKYLTVKTFKDYNELFETTYLDGVLVCTPPNLHYPIIKKAAEKDVHVFVEKPFTTKRNEALKLAELFNKKNLINQVGYVLRFNDCFVKSKQLIDDGVLGKIKRFKIEKYSATITSGDDSSGWRATRENGGGAVFEMASHAIDLVNYLIGTPDKVIGSSLTKIFSKNVEDAVSSTFLYTNGKSGYIDINWSDTSYRKPASKIEVFGANGKLIVNEHSIKVFLNEANEEEKLQKGWNTLYITDVFRNVPFYVRGNEFTRQLYEFANSILENKFDTLCTFDDGVKTLDIIEKIFVDYEQNEMR
ncbi:Gfo/Idh/MocA family oxidoreductase [uncultured Draconibacterium sp.]|uniref:Gfo/Idh/MocA family protein n=1 Tax=uncultured Draconibacterium sp. TaxID=1573823 RepID=UPI003216E4C0